jgi:hypothetical protein
MVGVWHASNRVRWLFLCMFTAIRFHNNVYKIETVGQTTIIEIDVY